MADAASCKRTVTKYQVEKILKSYRHICWNIDVLENSLNCETKHMGIDTDSLDFLKKAFTQNADIRKLSEENNNLKDLKILKEVIDFALKHLAEYPDNGKALYNIIYNLYIFREPGVRVKYNDAIKRHIDWANSENIAASVAMAKKRRNIAINTLINIINIKLNAMAASTENRCSANKRSYNEKERDKLNINLYKTTSKPYANL